MDQELENLPRLIEQMESKIKIEKDTIAAAAHELKSLESKNNTIENEINSISEHISRQKNKQLQVKKNEEYQALENEINNLVQQLSQREDQQIETLLKIDGAKETTEIAQNKISARVDDLEIEKGELVKKIELLKSDIQKLESEITESRLDVDDILLVGYERTKKVVARPPFIAPLEDQKCTGCNLRVSNDISSSVLVEQKLTHCDQCGRIVYFER
jgi:predicted  nucleic acid-binding Zn-ribbon protein